MELCNEMKKRIITILEKPQNRNFCKNTQDWCQLFTDEQEDLKTLTIVQ